MTYASGRHIHNKIERVTVNGNEYEVRTFRMPSGDGFGYNVMGLGLFMGDFPSREDAYEAAVSAIESREMKL